jgi:methyl-accepting chemotaxis protein
MRKITGFLLFCLIVLTNLYSSGEKEIIREDEYNNWLSTQIKIVDEISEIIKTMDSKDAIENECIRLIENGLNALNLYVAFSDDTAVFSDMWIPPDNWKPTERNWYKLAINANGETVGLDLYMDPMTGRMVITIVKYIGNIDDLDYVLGMDIFVPDEYFLDYEDNYIYKNIKYVRPNYT